MEIMVNLEDHESQRHNPSAKTTKFKPYPESHVKDQGKTCDNLPGVREGNTPHNPHPDTE